MAADDPPGTPEQEARPAAVAQLLGQLSEGDSSAADALMPLVYDELRALAGAYFRSERGEHTLQPTALVHEAWLRLAGSEQPAYGSKTHFLAIAAITMRRILVEHARARAASKRGGDWARISLPGASHEASTDPEADADVLAVHEALEKLGKLSPRQARIVELRWFGGLTSAEVAAHLGLVTRTVEKDWTMARAWLARELERA